MRCESWNETADKAGQRFQSESILELAKIKSGRRGEAGGGMIDLVPYFGEIDEDFH